MSEAAFFALGVLPYWYTIWLPAKDSRYWLVLAWCCCVWIGYMATHEAWAGLANNVVELGIVGWRLIRCPLKNC